MTARFVKDARKTLDGFDPHSPSRPYQMVPKGSERPMTLVTGNHKCSLSVGGSISMKDTSSAAPFSIKEIGPKTRYDFTIVSTGNADKAELVLEEERSTGWATIDVLSVSVKEELNQNFGLLFLSDTQLSTRRTEAEAVFIMRIIQGMYLKQANVRLIQVGVATPVPVQRSLGKPLILDKKLGFPTQTTPLDEILAATPSTFLANTLIRIYCCWDVGDIKHDPRRILGDTAGRSCFVEDGTNEFVFAHEIGHALGLGHNTRPNRLMDEIATPTFLLDRFEIDKINTSGT